MSIIVLLHRFGCELKRGLSFLLDFLHLFDPIGSRRYSSVIPEVGFSALVRMLTVIDEEGRESCGCLTLVVIGEFCKGEPVGPVVLLIVDEQAEILFDFLVHSLGLSICLRMIGSRGIGCDS